MSSTNPAAFNKAVGAKIRRMRKQRGMTQTAVGDVIGVSYQQVQKFESGENAVSAFQLSLVANLFGISLGELVPAEGVKSIPAETSPADNDSFLAARYVSRIADEKTRRIIVEMSRKFAYVGAA